MRFRSKASLDHTIASDTVLIGRELAQGHGAASVDFIGGDADFCAEAELFSIGQTAGNVVKNAGAIDVGEKCLRGSDIGGDDAIGVMRAVVVDVLDGFLE